MFSNDKSAARKLLSPGMIEQLKEFSALYGKRNVACAFTGRIC